MKVDLATRLCARSESESGSESIRSLQISAGPIGALRRCAQCPRSENADFQDAASHHVNHTTSIRFQAFLRIDRCTRYGTMWRWEKLTVVVRQVEVRRCWRGTVGPGYQAPCV